MISKEFLGARGLRLLTVGLRQGDLRVPKEIGFGGRHGESDLGGRLLLILAWRPADRPTDGRPTADERPTTVDQGRPTCVTRVFPPCYLDVTFILARVKPERRPVTTEIQKPECEQEEQLDLLGEKQHAHHAS